MIKQHKEFSCGAVGSLTGVVNAVTQVTAGCKFDPWPGNVHVPWVQPKESCFYSSVFGRQSVKAGKVATCLMLCCLAACFIILLSFISFPGS